MPRFYVFARSPKLAGTTVGYGYVETLSPSPEGALWQALRQPWPEGTELGVADSLNVYAVGEWVPAGAEAGAHAPAARLPEARPPRTTKGAMPGE